MTTSEITVWLGIRANIEEGYPYTKEEVLEQLTEYLQEAMRNGTVEDTFDLIRIEGIDF